MQKSGWDSKPAAWRTTSRNSMTRWASSCPLRDARAEKRRHCRITPQAGRTAAGRTGGLRRSRSAIRGSDEVRDVVIITLPATRARRANDKEKTETQTLPFLQPVETRASRWPRSSRRLGRASSRPASSTTTSPATTATIKSFRCARRSTFSWSMAR